MNIKTCTVYLFIDFQKATAGKDQILKIWVLRSYQSQLIELIKKHNNNSEESMKYRY